ncbi:hypothetical protein [Brevibacillus reuszeri]|uniref:hypothetical protein n=1 Tax=Brevibacillus reuszeri TaxID=54915 RepID=UPI000CCC409F|nr:hypothetical protein [Brevibacillus reuszeri]
MKIAVFVPVSEDVVYEAEVFVGNNSEAEAMQAFFKHTGVDYREFQSSMDPDELLREGDTIGSYIKIVEFPLQVVIEVYGGIAGVTSSPDGIEVQIIDHDESVLSW